MQIQPQPIGELLWSKAESLFLIRREVLPVEMERWNQAPDRTTPLEIGYLPARGQIEVGFRGLVRMGPGDGKNAFLAGTVERELGIAERMDRHSTELADDVAFSQARLVGW